MKKALTTEPVKLHRVTIHMTIHMTGQKQRKLGWKENRETELAKVQSKIPKASRNDDNQEDLVASLRQQLNAKMEECRHLMSRLDAIEEVNTKILRNQWQMQEDFNKVMFLQILFFWIVKIFTPPFRLEKSADCNQRM